LEFRAMNNPPRRWFQKYVEFRIFTNFLQRNHIDLTGKTIMDGGCGSGYSTELIVERFHPSDIVAFDYMPEMIYLARRRNVEAEFSVGDLTAIELSDGRFDAVFVFGVLHHIPEWRKALSEIARVLKTNGVFLVEEPRVRFTWKEFQSGMRDAGFEILDLTRLVFINFHFYLCRKTG
jgi:ubiquinone/menaquinone biosynthesis C-methylase UbiE